MEKDSAPVPASGQDAECRVHESADVCVQGPPLYSLGQWCRLPCCCLGVLSVVLAPRGPLQVCLSLKLACQLLKRYPDLRGCGLSFLLTDIYMFSSTDINVQYVVSPAQDPYFFCIYVCGVCIRRYVGACVHAYVCMCVCACECIG